MAARRDTYSLYEAKAKLSAIIRQVREGRRVLVTVHGQPVAEIRPVAQAGTDLAARMARLVDRGIVTPAAGSGARLVPVTRRRGALARFLDDRDG
jgi:prevent-host-death family protein